MKWADLSEFSFLHLFYKVCWFHHGKLVILINNFDQDPPYLSEKTKQKKNSQFKGNFLELKIVCIFGNKFNLQGQLNLH